jgi:hypothetical protein
MEGVNRGFVAHLKELTRFRLKRREIEQCDSVTAYSPRFYVGLHEILAIWLWKHCSF